MTDPAAPPPCSDLDPCPGPAATPAHLAAFGACHHYTEWAPTVAVITYRNRTMDAGPAPATARVLTSPDPLRTWDDFRAAGLLWYVNRVCFHPWGLALGLTADGWQLHPSPDGTPWTYGPDVEEGALLERVLATFAAYLGHES